MSKFLNLVYISLLILPLLDNLANLSLIFYLLAKLSVTQGFKSDFLFTCFETIGKYLLYSKSNVEIKLEKAVGASFILSNKLRNDLCNENLNLHILKLSINLDFIILGGLSCVLELYWVRVVKTG